MDKELFLCREDGPSLVLRGNEVNRCFPVSAWVTATTSQDEHGESGRRVKPPTFTMLILTPRRRSPSINGKTTIYLVARREREGARVRQPYLSYSSSSTLSPSLPFSLLLPLERPRKETGRESTVFTSEA